MTTQKKFKDYQPVEWESQAGGSTTKKQGFVVHVVQAGAILPAYYTKLLKSPGTPRDHESYLIEAEDSRGNLRYYWPKVSALRPLPPGAITMSQAQLLRRAHVKEQQKKPPQSAKPAAPRKAAPAPMAQSAQKQVADASPSGIEAIVLKDIADLQQQISKRSLPEDKLKRRESLQRAYEDTLCKAVYLRKAIEEIDSILKEKKA